ncbi:hypothetical protein ACJ73_05978 [Blastomyces percursus]|uniref:Uncharacterized protein n=1 Tax=Blastomyces percursus TaxID=1658174 RepID=A0A1J9Q280_9EURO|nr:hypothetical protein ACJ73_05978 [Blastomyces percursus]
MQAPSCIVATQLDCSHGKSLNHRLSIDNEATRGLIPPAQNGSSVGFFTGERRQYPDIKHVRNHAHQSSKAPIPPSMSSTSKKAQVTGPRGPALEKSLKPVSPSFSRFDSGGM